MITAITITAICLAAFIAAVGFLIRAGIAGQRGIVWTMRMDDE
jgi:hypothetical protein